MGNPALNGVILGAFAVGILYIIRQTLRLMPERDWLLTVKNTGKLDSSHRRASFVGHGLCDALRLAA